LKKKQQLGSSFSHPQFSKTFLKPAIGWSLLFGKKLPDILSFLAKILKVFRPIRNIFLRAEKEK